MTMYSHVFLCLVYVLRYQPSVYVRKCTSLNWEGGGGGGAVAALCVCQKMYKPYIFGKGAICLVGHTIFHASKWWGDGRRKSPHPLPSVKKLYGP